MVLTHIERNLRDGCPPGLHRYAVDQANAGFEECQACGRRQRRDGSACVICASDARDRFILVNRAAATRLEGALCSACGRELAYRGEVGGWTIERLARAS